jgi:hypothetical protein
MCTPMLSSWFGSSSSGISSSMSRENRVYDMQVYMCGFHMCDPMGGVIRWMRMRGWSKAEIDGNVRMNSDYRK